MYKLYIIQNYYKITVDNLVCVQRFPQLQFPHPNKIKNTVEPLYNGHHWKFPLLRCQKHNKIIMIKM